MQIYNAADEQALLRLLGPGTKEIPADVIEEYGIRRDMYHSAGASGNLPIPMLVDVVRFVGRKPPPRVVPQTTIDWRSMPSDGRVRVEALFDGAWKPGQYLGGVEGGTLAVRLDEDQIVRECRGHMMRLPTEAAPTKQDTFDAGVPEEDARTELLEKQEEDGQAEEPAPTTDAASPTEEDEDYGSGPPPAELLDSLNSDTDWEKVPNGADVWVEIGEDIVDASFEEVVSEKSLKVRFQHNNEVATVNRDLVQYAGEAA